MFGFGGKWKGFWRIMATRKRPSAPRKSLCEQRPWEDEVLREVYAARDAYAAERGYDLDRIFADLKRPGSRHPAQADESAPTGPGAASGRDKARHIDYGRT